MQRGVSFYSNRFWIVGMLLLNTMSTVNGSMITSVGYLFETFSPYAVMRFFEFSDKGWNISENCLKDMYIYLEGLKRGSIWAAKLYDAASFYSGATFVSSNVGINKPNFCRSLLHEYKLLLGMPQKLLDVNGSVVPFPVHIVIGQYLVEIADNNYFKHVKIQQLICFPQSCGHGDLQQILEVYLFQSNYIVKNNTYLKHRILSDNYSFIHDSDFYILISMFFTAVVLYCVIYILDIYLSSCSCEDECKTSIENQLKAKTKATLGQNIQIQNLPKIANTSRTFHIQEILDALSIQNVIYNVIQSDSNEFATAQATLFIVFVVLMSYFHLAAEIKFLAINLSPAIDDPYFHNLPTYVIDMFFVISGSKMANEFFKSFPRVEFDVAAQLIHTTKIIAGKISRFAPSYVFALFVERLLAKYFYYNVAIEIPSFDVTTCRTNLWRNVLYLDSFCPLSERCMPWTWFISLEVQFFIIASLVLLLSEIHRKYAVVIGITIFITSLFAATFTEIHRQSEQNSTRFLNSSSVHEILQFNLIFDNICLRVAPYLLGICLGCILHINNSRIIAKDYVMISGWISWIIIGALLLFEHKLLPSIYNSMLIRAALITLRHSMFALIIFWIIFASTTRRGEFLTLFATHQLSVALGNVSPVVLIIAPIVIRLLIFTADIPIYSSEGQIFLIGIGCFLLIYICALFLYVLIDRPLLAVFEVLLKGRFKTGTCRKRIQGKITI